MKKVTVFELALFGIFGGLMFATQWMMSALPNIHLTAVFIITLTVVYRGKAVFALLIYLLLTGIYNGFGLWWIPYLYLWPLLYGVTLLLPGKMKTGAAVAVYSLTAALHGYLFGLLYAPFQVLAFKMPWESLWSWVLAGLPFDFLHGTSNLVLGFLIVPLIKLLRKMNRRFMPEDSPKAPV